MDDRERAAPHRLEDRATLAQLGGRGFCRFQRVMSQRSKVVSQGRDARRKFFSTSQDDIVEFMQRFADR